MPHHREIYNQRAEQYELLVAREDYRGNILRALMEIHPFEGHSVVELGAGTGRLTRILAPLVKDIWLFDIFHHMLEIAVRALETGGEREWGLAVADHRNLPLKDGIADVVISGWSVCYLALWSKEGWWREVWEALREMERVLGRKGMNHSIGDRGDGV